MEESEIFNMRCPDCDQETYLDDYYCVDCCCRMCEWCAPSHKDIHTETEEDE